MENDLMLLKTMCARLIDGAGANGAYFDKFCIVLREFLKARKIKEISVNTLAGDILGMQNAHGICFDALKKINMEISYAQSAPQMVAPVMAPNCAPAIRIMRTGAMWRDMTNNVVVGLTDAKLVEYVNNNKYLVSNEKCFENANNFWYNAGSGAVCH